MTQVRLSRRSRLASEIDPRVSGSSVSPSPRKHHTRESEVSSTAAVVEVLEEAGVVERIDRAQPHRDGGVLPEVRHESGVGIRGEAAADLAPEAIEIVLLETMLDEGPGVDPGAA